MQELQARILAWAQKEEPVRAVTITGSAARGDGTADEWSDLDVQIITRDADRYTVSRDWLSAIGDVWICFAPDPHGSIRLVWFAGGKKVDFHFLPVDYVEQQIAGGVLSDEYRRGYTVVLDKDGLYSQLPPSPRQFPAPDPPTREMFRAVVDEFWFEAIHVAQFLRRREMWVVRFRDWTMKTDLLQMMEWHAQTQSDGRRNTWLIGKRIEEWVDPAARKSLSRIWASWDAGESWQALLESMKVFGRLSTETAEMLGLRTRLSCMPQSARTYTGCTPKTVGPSDSAGGGVTLKGPPLLCTHDRTTSRNHSGKRYA